MGGDGFGGCDDAGQRRVVGHLLHDSGLPDGFRIGFGRLGSDGIENWREFANLDEEERQSLVVYVGG